MIPTGEFDDWCPHPAARRVPWFVKWWIARWLLSKFGYSSAYLPASGWAFINRVHPHG